MKLSASNANLYDKCPAAAFGHDDNVSINPVDEAGNIGSAVHEALALMVMGQNWSLDEIGDRYELDKTGKKDLGILFAVGRKWYEANKHQLGNVYVEQELKAIDTYEMTGHTDLMGQLGNVVRVVDYKSTRLENVNYKPQMMQYLWLAWQSPDSPVKDAATFQDIIIFLRDQTQDISPEYSTDELQAWHDSYVEKIRDWDGKTYCSGGHCGYCPRQADCPGLNEQLRHTLATVNNTDLVTAINSIEPAACVDLYENIRLAEKQLAHAVEIIKMRCPLEGDGKSLVLQERSRDTILAQRAWPVIVKHLNEAEIAPAVSIRKTSLLDAVAAKAPRGQKKQAKENLIAELREVYAIETSTFFVPAIVANDGTKLIEGDTDNE